MMGGGLRTWRVDGAAPRPRRWRHRRWPPGCRATARRATSTASHRRRWRRSSPSPASPSSPRAGRCPSRCCRWWSFVVAGQDKNKQSSKLRTGKLHTSKSKIVLTLHIMGIFSKLTLRTAGSIPSDSARKGGRKDKKTDKETVPGEHRDRQMLRATVFFLPWYRRWGKGRRWTREAINPATVAGTWHWPRWTVPPSATTRGWAPLCKRKKNKLVEQTQLPAGTERALQKIATHTTSSWAGLIKENKLRAGKSERMLIGSIEFSRFARLLQGRDRRWRGATKVEDWLG